MHVIKIIKKIQSNWYMQCNKSYIEKRLEIWKRKWLATKASLTLAIGSCGRWLLGCLVLYDCGLALSV